jgi:hypothetical protein
MAMVPSPTAEPNSVIEVMQPGYLLNGRLVRAAKVVVAQRRRSRRARKITRCAGLKDAVPHRYSG